MIHGCQKQMLHIRGTDSKLFEEAFVILRPGALNRGCVASREEMLREAEFLVRNALDRLCPAAHRRRRRAPLFFLGFLLGGAAGAAVLWLFYAF